jgi:malate/lactate dehydrogenase
MSSIFDRKGVERFLRLELSSLKQNKLIHSVETLKK